MDTIEATSGQEAKGDLIHIDRALESWRDAGYDLFTASGEVVDNSIEAGAKLIRIETKMSQVAEGRKTKKSIDEIAYADDGAGIPHGVLRNALTMGFSTRYNRRDGLGRFGVGAKLAALSQARRADIYTRPIGDANIYHTYFDLDDIRDGKQEFLSADTVEAFPSQFAHLMCYDNGLEFESGTLVIWSKVDRIDEGGKFGSSVDEHMQELFKYLGRTYRRFLSNGLSIVLNNTDILLHDPLFLLENPRAKRLLGEERHSEVIDSNFVEIDDHKVEITVTLLPKIVRLKSGEGGTGGKGEPYKELHIADNQGKVSILRHGREIYYDVIPRLFPGGVDKVDRYIGVEVAFPAALDEYFQVRHVKRGAEPVSKLRDQIRKFVEKPIEAARKRVRATWSETETTERTTTPTHTAAVDAYKKMEETSPRGLGGNDVSLPVAEALLEDTAKDLGAETPQEVEKIKDQIRNESITVTDGSWPGKELMDITHLNGRVIIKFNKRHPFMRDIYQPIKNIADGKTSDLDPVELQSLARRIEAAVDLLFFSYAKAENMHRHPDEQYGNLRAFWGQFASEAVRELLQQI